MKDKLKKKLDEKRKKNKEGTNNGWLNFLIEKECRGCGRERYPEMPTWCGVIDKTIGKDKKCKKQEKEQVCMDKLKNSQKS